MLLTLVWLAVAHATSTTPPPEKCPRAPEHAQPADADYKLGVAGDPDLFLAGELYTVSLRSIDAGQGPTPFIGFTIWAERVEETPDIVNITNSTKHVESDISTVGMFQAYDAQTKTLAHCTPAVTNATAHPKTEIQALWNAPSSEYVTSCVRLCARAGPRAGGAYAVLCRKLCPAPAAPSSVARQPPIVEPCCACDEAKYEVTFEGLWSRNTHAREFPPDEARAHFGDIIGASHTAQYRVWQEGRAASAGMRKLAEDGSTTAIEKELKAESDHIRTIIKARGISWQHLAGGGIPSTFAVFRVDAKKHLVSLASKLAPSPDWIVGVSALELCNANCTWRMSFTLPLYPYDAGTDDGLGYTSRRSPSSPPVPVRALRPDWPRDVRSPFYNTDGHMRPFARLRLNRLRLYEKSCDGVETPGEKPSEPSLESEACATHAWGPWAACSVTCGEGRTSRQRDYIYPARAYAEACRTPLTEYKRCHGLRRHCRGPTEYEPDPASSSGPCAVSVWSTWSTCEGCGVRARTRHYLAPRALKRCHQGFRASTELSQARPCDAGPCHVPAQYANSKNFDWFYQEDKPRGPCPVSPWGDWSPCSAHCGRGRRLRARMLLAPSAAQQAVLLSRLLHQWNTLFSAWQNITVPPKNITSPDPLIQKSVDEFLERCQFTLTQQEAFCEGEEPSCANVTVDAETCKLDLMVGHCRNYIERWFYEFSSGRCEPFGFSGCGGNRNNFPTHEACMTACGHVGRNATAAPETSIPETSTTDSTTSKRLKATPPTKDNEVLQNDDPIAPVSGGRGYKV